MGNYKFVGKFGLANNFFNDQEEKKYDRIYSKNTNHCDRPVRSDSNVNLTIKIDQPCTNTRTGESVSNAEPVSHLNNNLDTLLRVINLTIDFINSKKPNK